MSVCFVKRKFAAWSLALTLAVLASLLITSFVFAESEDLPAVPEENEPAAAESGGTAEAPAVEAPGEAQPADESGGETEPPQDEGESGGETEPPQDEGEAEVEIEPPQEEVAEPVTETIPAEDTEAVVNPVEEPCQENVVPQVETPVEELETTLLEPAEAEEATNGIVDAAQLTGGGDPYWYVGTKKYAVVTNISLCPADAYQCWVSTTPIQKALDKIEDESLLPTDKKLYVLAGIYTEDISFEGELLSKMNGLIGVDGSTTTIINGDIYIPFNTGGFTLSGFTINGGVEVTDSTGNLVFSDLVVTNTNGDGIHVTGGTDEEYDEWPHPGTVTLDHVNSSNNQGAGAYIQSKNTIIVTNSTFDNNDNRDFDFPDQRAGLYLQNNWYPGGFKVELYNVIANQNYGNGITIKTGNAVIQNVTANGNKSYSDSWDNIIGGDGLFVYATNSLNMNNITAFSNEDEGVYADSKVVTIKNFIANDNEGSGVSTYSWQKINVENVTANDNGAFGVVAYGYGGINAAITIKNIIANGNGYSGIIVQNQNGGAVTITNTTTNGNTQVGVFIISGGTVKLTTIRSSNNSQHGLFVEGYERWKDNGYWDEEDNWVEDWVFLGLASPLVTLASPADANFVNVFNNNGGLGIYIRSDKPVVITNFKANNNASSGLEVEGMCKWDEDAGSYVDCHPSGALTIKSTITGFNNTLDGNGYIGIEVADANGAVIIERTQVTNGHNMGIYINTLGAITLKDVKSNTNRESGLVLLNNGALKAVPITLTNVEASGSLEYNGIYARSKGAITLNNVIANNNHWSGADLDNCLLDDGSGLCLGSGTITITNASGKLNTFNNNGRFGVWAVSKGAITVTNIQANNNGSDGASLRNNYGGSIANVTVAVSGATRNEFNGNGLNESYMPVDDYYKVGLNGLTIKTLGNISVKNVLAQNNQNEGGGIVVRNDESVTPKTVLISDCEVSGNDWHGLFVYSKGNITLTNISADTNHISGVFADNCLYDDVSGTCGGTGTVTLTNVTSNENWNRGIEVHSKGVISLTNGTALDNTGNEGVFLENRYTGSIANVTLKNITSNENNSSGVFILTNGAVTLSNITANNNHCMQGWLNDGQTAQDYYNAEQGDDRWSFYLEAGTAYTISMLGSGIGFTNLSTFVAMMKLYDENAPETPINSGQTINFTPGTSGWYYVLVNNNDGTDGLYRISLAGENIPNPGSPDMMFWVDGVSVTAGGNVTLKNGTFDDNSLSGLYAETNGNIIISNAGGSLNGGDGFDLYNNGGVGNITLTGTNLANDNGWRGIEVKTNGVLSLNNLEASNNGQHGIKIDAQGAGKAVTLKGITVMNNLLDGLNISANGKLTLNDIRSWLNGGSGAVLDTHGNALLVQSSVFMCNGEYGLEYKDYALPFTFTDKSNVYFGNTSGTTYKN